jgi:hypothetical protein
MRDFVSLVLTTIRMAFWPPGIETAVECKRAAKFRESSLFKSGVEFGWVFDYAQQYYEKLSKVWKELDDKANEIIKYLGGGTGLFALGLMTKDLDPRVIRAALPAIGCALFAVFSAVLARKPNEVWVLPDAKAAYDYAVHKDWQKEQQGKTEFIGQIHEQSEKLYLSIKIKSSRVTVATWFFFLAISLLVLPIAVLLQASH